MYKNVVDKTLLKVLWYNDKVQLAYSIGFWSKNYEIRIFAD